MQTHMYDWHTYMHLTTTRKADGRKPLALSVTIHTSTFGWSRNTASYVDAQVVCP
jgi:hypothetical protein